MCTIFFCHISEKIYVSLIKKWIRLSQLQYVFWALIEAMAAGQTDNITGNNLSGAKGHKHLRPHVSQALKGFRHCIRKESILQSLDRHIDEHGSIKTNACAAAPGQ